MSAPAKKPVKPANSPQDLTLVDDELSRGEIMPDDIAVLQLLEELSGNPDATVRIYRQGKGGYRDLTLLDEMPISEFKPINLRDEPFNGGEFRIHILNGTGFAGNKFLRVEPRPKKIETVVSQGNNEMMLLASAMTSGFQELGKLIVGTAQNRPPIPTRKDMLDEMQIMSAILKPATVPVERTNTAAEVLSSAREMLRMVESMKPEKSLVSESGEISENALLLGMAERFFTAIGKMKENTDAVQPLAIAANPGNGGGSPAMPVTPVEKTEVNQMVETMRMFLGVLINQAVLNGDCETYANVILDHAGESRALQYLSSPDWFDKLTAMNKDVMHHRGWFDELRGAIVEICRESDNAEIVKIAKAIRLTGDTVSDNVVAENPPVIQ